MEPESHFCKEDMQTANKHMQICSTSLAIRELQIKTRIRYDFTLTRMTRIKKSCNDKCWQVCEEIRIP